MPVQAGAHSISLSAPVLLDDVARRLDGDPLRANFACRDGELLYITLSGREAEAYSAGRRLVNAFRWGRAEGTVMVSSDPPQSGTHLVLLNQLDWILPEDKQGR